ncbi:hypothetical protein [Sodalis sp. dw_96]|uniref:hypothetical protein n=1 Tax=Sodalis sp. dw_96 TaxID=2719794 RepID=UPI001BD44A2C|nr:hypothetical protein [Sodalis sp. dw_96]
MRRFIKIFSIISLSVALSGCGWNNAFWSDELGPDPGQVNQPTNGNHGGPG